MLRPYSSLFLCHPAKKHICIFTDNQNFNFLFESGERPKRVIYISKFSDIEMSTFQFFTSDFDSKLTVAVSEKYLQMMEKNL